MTRTVLLLAGVWLLLLTRIHAGLAYPFVNPLLAIFAACAAVAMAGRMRCTPSLAADD
jgi:hypothetical protein